MAVIWWRNIHSHFINGLNTRNEIGLMWMSQHFTNEKSTLVQVMAWCRQTTSHCLSQCRLRSCRHTTSLNHNELIHCYVVDVIKFLLDFSTCDNGRWDTKIDEDKCKGTCSKSLIIIMTTSWHGPLARYAKSRVAHAPVMPGTFSPPLTSKETAS